jgi:hypothetical protein
MTGDYVIGTQYTGYSITYSFSQTQQLGFVTGFTAYSGLTSASQENFSAGTLDYKGPLDYISSVEDATIDGRLTTDRLTVTGGASLGTLGYVLTQTGNTGEVGWVFNSSSATTNTFVSGGTLNGTNLDLTYNTGGSVPSIELSGITYWSGGSGLYDTLGNHTMTTGSNTDFSIISGGENNEISAGVPISKWNSILGGSGNTISAANFGVFNNVILGGFGNFIGGAGAGNSGCAIIGGEDNNIGSTAINSVIIGMSGKSVGAGANDTVYVSNLNIGTIGAGSPVNNLGFDSLGNVVTGTTGGAGGVTIDPYNNSGSGTTISWDVSGTSTNYEATFTGNTTLNLINVRNGDYGTIIVTQDGVGSHTLTFNNINGGAGTHYVVNGGGGTPILTSNPNAIDILSFTYNGSAMYWTVGNDYT